MGEKARREDAQRRNEFASATLLASHLRVGELSRGDPAKREPDYVADTDAGTVGIECVNVYIDEGDAAWLWEMALEAAGSTRERRHRGEVVQFSEGATAELSAPYENPTAKIREHAQAAITSKCRKAYAVPTYLVVNARHLVLVAGEGPSVVASLRVPDGCLLRGAYLCVSENFAGTARIFEIGPTRTDGRSGIA